MTFDPAELLWIIFIILMMVQVLPFTPVVVGLLLIGSTIKVKMTVR